MPKLIYGLLTADLIVDRDSGSTSYIRTVEHAVVPEMPAVLPPIFFASLWDLDRGGHAPFTVALSLRAPDNTSVTLGVQEVTPGETMLHKMNFQLPGLSVRMEGRHDLVAAVKDGDDWETVAELPLYVFTTPRV